MKYTIHGFSQKKAVELGLDNDDLLILRYFIDFKDSGAMVSTIIKGKTFYWVKYEAILEQLPILKLKKDSVYRRLKKMCKLGVLEHKTMKKNGTYSFYSVGKVYIGLTSEINPNSLDNKVSEINPREYGNKSERVRKQIREGTETNPDQKINLLKDSSIKNNSSSRGNMEVFKHFEKCNFGLLSPMLIEKIAVDIEIYSKEWVMKAAEISDSQGKHTYAYVKGILERWKAQGYSNKTKEEIVDGRNKQPSRQGVDESGIGFHF
ncbi:DnaD domain protein [Clostridium cochlearium]|uniref:DnaD domain-containing protein n=1 Tax=Clostridium cochlearium TaxID=1494 RepID=UPI0014593643|nr:DnaD domain protein [Clostridium cochlearium]NME95326.1 DnaD domain protein [Clostridium cochlearium]